jgi:hypothetical protein
MSPPGAVTILNMTVDGSNSGLTCAGARSDVYMAGIFYASDTAGAVQASTLRFQKEQGIGACANALWVDNEGAATESMEVASVSIHDFDTIGIQVHSGPPTLSLKIVNNSVYPTDPVYGVGILVNGVTDSVSQNLITGGA